jgi:hypothetical protein
MLLSDQVGTTTVDYLCSAIIRVIDSGAYSRKVLDIAEPQAMSYRDMLAAYRNAMELSPPFWFPVPMALMRVGAVVASCLPQRVFSPDTLRMLEDGSIADSTTLTDILGTQPYGVKDWFTGAAPEALRFEAIGRWAFPLFRVVLAIVWIVTGLLSLGLYPVSDSMALLRQVGLEGLGAHVALYGAAMLDCLLGIATLRAPGRLLWRLQLALIAAYSAIISIFLPQYWLHPFGPLLKNLPILAILVVLDAGEARKTTR